MAKKETTPKAKAAKEVKKPKVEKPEKDVVDTNQNVGVSEATQSTISSQEGKDTSKEKEGLKSKENKSNGLTFDQAEKLMDQGFLLRRAAWVKDNYFAAWFKSTKTGESFALNVKEIPGFGYIGESPFDLSDDFETSNDWEVVEPTPEQEAILSKFWEEKTVKDENKKAKEEYSSLKAVSYNKAKGGSFHKLKNKISIEDLEKRQDLPNDSSRTSEFVMSNGQVFDLESGLLTNKKS